MPKTIAHCIESVANRPMPFVTDQVVGLDKYKPIVFSFMKDIWRDGWQGSPLYLPYGHDRSKQKQFFNRIIRKLSGIPWDFYKALRKHNVRLLHAHFIPTAIQFLPLKRRYNLPMIVSSYGYDVSRFPRESEENLSKIKMLFEKADLFLAMSEDMERDLLALGCPSKKIIIHHTGVDTKRFHYRKAKTNDDRVLFLCVCDYSPKKGVPILIEAMVQVHKKHPEAKLRIIGTPKWRGVPIKKQVEKMMHDMKLQDTVDLADWADYYDLPEQYAKADIFVLSSQTDSEGNKEGIPAVIMEAMATGLPIVSTNHAGIPEVVIDGETGYLVQEEDFNELAERMCKFIEERQTWESMGLAGMKFIEKEFNVEIQKRKLETIYNKILED